MNGTNQQSGNRVGLSPWIIIMFTAPVPLFLFIFFFYKWYHDRTDFSHMASQFVQRQNQVIAVDAMGISRIVTQILETAANDVEAFSLVSPSARNFHLFYRAHRAPMLELDDAKKVTHQVRIPLYSRLTVLKSNGDEIHRFEKGESIGELRILKECLELDLCDRKAREKAVQLQPGQLLYGNLMRYYIPDSEPPGKYWGSLAILYRTKNRIYELGLDYRHLRSILYMPSFPYQPKTDLLHAYENGNYIYLLDMEHNFILHPKYWHLYGIDKETGKVIGPVITDADWGKRRLNVAKYKGDNKGLRDYFDRLLTKSFAHRTVDIFRASNLKGTNRVVAVTPVFLSRGQFKKTGIFGHIAVGCNVDFFEEPKDQLVPYY